MANRVEVELAGKETALLSTLANLDKTVGQIDRRFESVARSSRRSQQAVTRAFGSQAVNQLQTFAAGFVSISAAAALARSAINEMSAARDRAARKVVASERGLASLSQLADTPEGLAELIDAAKTTFAEGGAPDLDAAGRQIFALKSAGSLDQRKLVSQLGATGLVDDSTQFAESITTLLTNLGEKETGGFRALASKAFAASAETKTTAPDLLAAATEGAQSARALKISDEELLAAAAVVTKATKSPEKGGTQLASLLKSLDRLGFQDQTLAESLTQLEKRGLSGAELQKTLGRQEAVAGFRALTTNRDLFQKVQREAVVAERDDLVGSKLALPATVPGLRAAQVRRKAVAREELGGREMGTTGVLVEAAIEAAIDEQRRRGASEGALAFARMRVWMNRQLRSLPGVGGDEALLERDILPHTSPEFQRETQELLRQIRDNTKGVNDKTERGRENRVAPAAAAHSRDGSAEDTGGSYMYEVNLGGGGGFGGTGGGASF